MCDLCCVCGEGAGEGAGVGIAGTYERTAKYQEKWEI